jgi:Tfp pilus assembly protein PilO
MTPLLKRVLAEHRPIVAALALAVLANIVFAFIVHERGVKAAGAADRAVAAAAALRTAEHEHTVARALVTGKARADEELNAFYRKVLPADHEEAVRMTYASLAGLAQRSGLTSLKRSYEVDQGGLQKHTLDHLVITMALLGEYEDFRRFMYGLESAPEFLIIDDVVLTEGKSNAPLAFVIKLSTYFRAKAHGA